jgi:hypothetical protein
VEGVAGTDAIRPSHEQDGVTDFNLPASFYWLYLRTYFFIAFPPYTHRESRLMEPFKSIKGDALRQQTP